MNQLKKNKDIEKNKYSAKTLPNTRLQISPQLSLAQLSGGKYLPLITTYYA
jgi:hypothetical protein